MTRYQHVTRAVLCLIVVSAVHTNAPAADGLTPEDECVLELTLPEGSTAKLGEGDYVPKRKFTYRSLEPGTTYYDDLSIRYPSGQTSQHKLFIEGGRRLRFAQLDPADNMPIQALQTGHAAPITAAAFSRDSRYLATGDRVGKIVVWDTRNLRQVRSFSPKGGVGREILAMPGADRYPLNDSLFLNPSVVNIHFSSDGTLLAVEFSIEGLEMPHNLVVWDLHTGKELHRLDCEESIECAAISPSEPRLAARIMQGTREMFLLELSLEMGEVDFNSALENTIDEFLKRQLVFFDTKSGRVVRRLDNQVRGTIDCSEAVFSHNGSRIYAILSDQLIYTEGFRPEGADGPSSSPTFWMGVWNGVTGKLLSKHRIGRSFVSGPADLRLSSDGKNLYFTAAETTQKEHGWLGSYTKALTKTCCYDLKVNKLSEMSNTNIESIAVTKHLAEKSQLFVRSASNGTWATLKGHLGEELAKRTFPIVFRKPEPHNRNAGVTIVSAISPDGELVFLSGQAANKPQKSLVNQYLWDVGNNQLRPWLEGSLDPINEMSVSTNGRWCATSYDPRQIFNRPLSEDQANARYPEILWDCTLGQPTVFRNATTPERQPDPYAPPLPKAPKTAPRRLPKVPKAAPERSAPSPDIGEQHDIRKGSHFDYIAKRMDTGALRATSVELSYQEKSCRLECEKRFPEGYPKRLFSYPNIFRLRLLEEFPVGGHTPKTLWEPQANMTTIGIGQESINGRYTVLTGDTCREIWYDVMMRRPLSQAPEDMSWNELRPESHIQHSPRIDAPEYPYTFDLFDVSGGVATVRDKETKKVAFTLRPKLKRAEELLNVTPYWQVSHQRWLLRCVAAKPFISIIDLEHERVLDFTIPVSGSGELAILQSEIYAAAISTDSRLLAASAGTGEVYLWDIETQRLVDTIHVGATACGLVFSLDNKHLVLGAGNEVWVWNLNPRGILRKMHGHAGAISSVTFACNGKFILSSSEDDGATRVWDFATGKELAKMLTVNRGKDWLVTTPEGLFDGSAAGRKKVFWRVGGGLNVVPVDRFFQDFYYPGLLAAIWHGERPLPKVQFGDKVPPTVRIVSPKKGGAVEKGSAVFEVEVVDRGGGISGPWIRQNGQKVVVNKQTERDGLTLRQKFEMLLVEGKNEIEIQAASADGAWESEPARIALNYQQPPRKSDLYIVSIGVGDYPGKKLDLKYARTDAEAMVELFVSRGPTLYKNIYQTNLRNKDATKERILAAIRTVAGKASPRDTVVLFFAGHGAMVDDQYYFLPGDFEVGDQKWDEAVARRALAALEVGQVLTTVPALKRLLVFDTGQSGVVAKETTSRNPFAFRGAIERLGRSQGGFTIASCSSTKDAHEVADLRHGILTYSLLAGMKAANGGPLGKQWIEPDAEDRTIRVLQWFGFADSHVPQLTQEFFGRAQPVQHSSAGISFPVLPIPRGGSSSHSQTTENTHVEELRPAMATRFDIGGSADKTDLYLVAVGINKYADSTLNLDYARSDAEAIIKLFRQRGPAIYENIHVVPLLDKKATKRGIIEALDQVAKKAGPEDTLMLFVSGHGKMVGQRYYLITHEFKKGNGLLDTEVSAQCLPVDEIGDGLSKIQARKRLLVFDTCASGGALGLKQGAVDPFAFRGAIDRLGAKQGTFVIAASAASEEAQEHSTLGHGVLTYALLAGLDAVDTGPLDHRSIRMTRADGLVDVFQWFSFASGQGPRLMKQLYGHEQFIQTSGKGVSFPVLPLSSLPTRQPATTDETLPTLPHVPKHEHAPSEKADNEEPDVVLSEVSEAAPADVALRKLPPRQNSPTNSGEEATVFYCPLFAGNISPPQTGDIRCESSASRS